MRGSGVGSAGQAQSLLGAIVTPTPEYRIIPLSLGYEALVDAADFDWLTKFKWSPNVTPWGAYARRNGPTGSIRAMHRAILNVSDPNLYVDHINGNGMDNRRCNLRVATKSQNQYNRGMTKTNTTGYKGIYRYGQRWKAQIRYEGKRIALGVFDTAEAAGKAYQEAAKEYHGDFAQFGVEVVEERTIEQWSHAVDMWSQQVDKIKKRLAEAETRLSQCRDGLRAALAATHPTSPSPTTSPGPASDGS